MKDKEVIISDPGDEVEPITAELKYLAVILIIMITFLFFGAVYHPRSKFKSNIEKNDREINRTNTRI